MTFSLAKTALKLVRGHFLVKSQTRLGAVLKMLGIELAISERDCFGVTDDGVKSDCGSSRVFILSKKQISFNM